MDLRREQVVAFVLVTAITAGTFALFKVLQISTQAAVITPVRIQGALLSDAGFNPATLFGRLLMEGIVFALPFLLLSTAFAALAIYGLIVGDDKRLGPLGFAVGGLAGVAVVGATFTSVSMLVGLIIASVFVPGAAARTYQETTRWKNYTSVSRASGRGLLVLNIFVALGVFLTVFTNQPLYTQLYLSETKQSLEAFGAGELTDAQIVERLPASVREKYESLPPDKQKAFLEDYKQLKEEAPRQGESGEAIAQLVTLYLYITPVVVFGALEMLRSFVLMHVAGLVAVPIMRRHERVTGGAIAS